MITSGLMSSNTDQWATPLDLFSILDNEFKFTLDVCADASNHKVARYFDRAIDGLAQDWTKDVCWMNPPYGREIPKWVRKARDTARGGGRSGGIIASTHGHRLVAGRHGGHGAALHQGPRTVRRSGPGTVPLGHSDMGHAEGPDNQDNGAVKRG